MKKTLLRNCFILLSSLVAIVISISFLTDRNQLTDYPTQVVDKRKTITHKVCIGTEKTNSQMPQEHEVTAEEESSPNQVLPQVTNVTLDTAKKFTLSLPLTMENKTAVVGDLLVLHVGDQRFVVELTTAAYMKTGFLFEGTIGEDGLFNLGAHQGTLQGALVPSVSYSDRAYTLEGNREGAEWIEKPLSEVYCAGISEDYSHDEIIPLDYYIPEERGIDHPIPIHQSRPEATAVILLDFDDHQLDSEGNPLPGLNPFNRLITTEQMTFIWEKVSEHLVFFDVNVTTDESVYLAAPLAQNLRVIFRNSSKNSNSQLAAMALLTDGDFTLVQFAMNLQHAMPTMQDIVSTTIHEIGHGLNLRHDGGGGDGSYYLGDGEGKAHWSPIMGSNYSRRFIQWSIGEYAGSNNREDDLQLMQNCGQFGYVQDDHSDLADASATDLATTVGPEWDGVIGEKKDLNQDGTYTDDLDVDVDVFSYTATSPGLLEIDVLTKVLSPLNVKLELVDANGELQVSTAMANPLDSLDGKIRCLVDPGTYYLKVAPAGRTLPNGLRLHTTYATMGSYKIEYSVREGSYSEYAISSTIGEGGSINLHGTDAVFSGDNRSVKIEADNGYQIKDLIIDGQLLVLTADEKNMGYVHSFNNIQDDHSIVATFESSVDLIPLPHEGNVGWDFTGNVIEVSDEAAYGSQSLKLLPSSLPSSWKDAQIDRTRSFAAGTVSFCYHQLSHDGMLEFSVDGEVVFRVEGYSDWTRFSHEISEGYHTLSWKYIKNGWLFDEINEGAWIDELQLPAAGPPIAFDQSLGVYVDQAIDLLLTGYDLQGDYLTYTVVDQPQNGVLTGSGPDLKYVPNPGYNGTDSFTYKVSDGATDSATATVMLHVTAVEGDLELHWSFDSSEGTPVMAVDESGNGRDGNVLGSATRVTGPFGQAMNFDGVDDAVIKNISQIILPQYSVSFWAKAASLGQASSTGLFSNNGDKTKSDDFQIDIDGSSTNYYRYNSFRLSGRMHSFQADTWVHIAVVCDGLNTYTYQNGVQTGHIAKSGNYFGEFVLGMDRTHLNFFAGMLDELRVYSRPLTDLEVAALSAFPASDRHALTVVHGLGTGERSEGSLAEVRADAPAAGFGFKQWNGDYEFLEDRYSPITQLDIPDRDVGITAIYSSLHSASVINGSGSGEYIESKIVTMTAEPAVTGKVFDGWVGDIQYLGNASSATTTLTMPDQAVAITATYRVVETIEDGLLLHWGFDGTGDDSTVEDISGNNRSGNFFGDPVRSEGLFGQAIELDGNGDYVIHDIAQTHYDTYSVSFWVKASALEQSASVGLFSNNSNGTDFQVDISENATNYYRYTSGNVFKNIGNFNLADWAHIAITCSGTQTRFYFNGKSVSATYSKLGQDFGEFTLGANRGHNASFCFHGLMDELLVYDRALTAEEISALSNPPAAAEHVLTVNNGNGSGGYKAGESVSVTAVAPGAEYQFINWSSSGGGEFVNSFSPSTVFTMPASGVSITANYLSSSSPEKMVLLQRRPDGSMVLGFELTAGRSYRIEYSSDLVNWFDWEADIPVSETTIQFELLDDGVDTVTHPKLETKRFYRLIDFTAP